MSFAPLNITLFSNPERSYSISQPFDFVFLMEFPLCDLAALKVLETFTSRIAFFAKFLDNSKVTDFLLIISKGCIH